jgi:hypothetical protein
VGKRVRDRRRQARYRLRRRRGECCLVTWIGDAIGMELLLRDARLIPHSIEATKPMLETAASLMLARLLSRVTEEGTGPFLEWLMGTGNGAQNSE